ncbi:MAG: ATP-binding protein [Acidobacteriota bacterium]|jgi:hypothetical protein|nr:ATP-binding protein [Acidobacteriota bacterium]
MHRGRRDRINLGSSIFRNFIEDDCLFVDKSAFVEHVLDDSSSVLLFTRPRRMGKSLNLDMLRTFLDFGQDAVGEGLFKGLYIETSPYFSQAGRAPVIYLNFRDCRMKSYKTDYVLKIMEQISRYLREDQYSASMRLALSNPEIYAHQLLRLLIENLKAVYAAPYMKPYVLIDEYDKLIMDSVGQPEFDEVRSFTKTVLSMALKDNAALGKGVLTGVNRIAQESMFSDLNNIKVYDVLTESVYDADFGFTEREVREICTDAEINDVRQWYNGYRVGGEKVYFTFSVMSYLASGRLDNYWGKSGIIDSIKRHLTAERFDTLTEIVGGFGASAMRVRIKDRLSAEDLLHYAGDESFYSLLVQTGYLTYERTDTWSEYDVSLPNLELESVWRDFILTKFYNTRASTVAGALETIATPERFAAVFTELLDDKLSYFDFEAKTPERTHHVFVAGLLAAAGVRFRSNRESGLGRFDITALLADKTIIFEFKRTQEGEQPESAAARAISQIIEKGYAHDTQNAPRNLPVYAVGVGFSGKTCVARAQQLHPESGETRT